MFAGLQPRIDGPFRGEGPLRWLLVSLAIAGGLQWPAPAQAYFLDGDELLNHCSINVADDRFDPAICVSYIMGAYDGFMFQRLVRNQPRCTPARLTGGQLREVVVQYLRDANCTLAIEPGRSLADQAAITLFRIHGVKPLATGGHVIFVEGSSFSACETWFSSEFLVDPLLIPSGPRAHAPVRAYIAGHSCLDDDVITNRWIGFPTVPQRGDLLVYANTAGYQMDLLENEFHRHPMPHRLLALQDASGALRFEPDKPVE